MTIKIIYQNGVAKLLHSNGSLKVSSDSKAPSPSLTPTVSPTPS